MPKQSKVLIEHEGTTAVVDEDLAALILALWQHGFRTAQSCAAQEGTTMREPISRRGKIVGWLDAPLAWIRFTTEDEAEKAQQLTGGLLIVNSGLAGEEPSFTVSFASTRITASLEAVVAARPELAEWSTNSG